MNKRTNGFSRKLISLTKISIMLPVALTAVTGYFLYSPSFSFSLAKIVSGVLLLAIAASVLNQIQERKLDARMKRTKERPLANESLSAQMAWIIFTITLLSGSIILFYGGGPPSLVTGLITLVWYNGVYTYLKRITAFAVVPGALTGALPPLIGYVGAGGGATHEEILALCFVFFMAQIPHFWMIQIRYGEEYIHAGLPSLTSLFNKKALERLTFIWVLASLATAMLLPMFRIITETTLIYCLLGITTLVLILFLNRLNKWIPLKEGLYFGAFNLYYLIVMGLVVAEKL
jgi:heme o synthase